VRFEPPLRRGVLVRRYKRFLVDVELPSGEVVTMHCPNTGAMTGCAEAGSTVWYSTHADARRKYRHSLELVETARGDRIGIHSARANALVAEALATGTIVELGHCRTRSEVAAPGAESRFDFGLLDAAGSLSGFLEVKSVTLSLEDGWGAFPDVRSTRAVRHANALTRVRRQGGRAILLFCVQHTAIVRLRPADHVDPSYGMALREARDAGVEIIAYRTQLDPEEIRVSAPVAVVL
jgi:sugar fermentation stimulation protein A